MTTFIIVTSIILGMLIGSFLNVVILRFNTGKGLGGRSQCFSCGKTLSWYELVPVFSWLIQKGRCRKCKTSISPMYLMGELTAGIAFGLLAARGFFWKVDITGIEYLIGTGFLFIVFSFLLVIFWYDLRHKIIPDIFSFIFGALAFISMFFFDTATSFVYSAFSLPSFWQFLAGVIVPLPFFLVWLVSKGRWMGLGDPKLMVGIGWLFGIAQGFSAVVISFWIGALFVILLMLIKVFTKKQLLDHGKKSIMKQEVPFAPFLIIATLLTLVFDVNLFVLI